MCVLACVSRVRACMRAYVRVCVCEAMRVTLKCSAAFVSIMNWVLLFSEFYTLLSTLLFGIVCFGLA